MATSMYGGRTDSALIKQIFLTTILHCALGDIISDCCPSNSVMTQRNSDTKNPYECTKKIEFDNISDETEINIPECDAYESMDITNNDNSFNMSTNGCIDYLSNTLHVIGCANSEENTEVYRVNKCCQENFSYHSKILKCQPKINSSLDVLTKLLGNYTVILNAMSVPNCSNDEVFVEYYMNTSYEYTSISLNGLHIKFSELNISDASYFPAKSYCIEELDIYDDASIYNFTTIVVRGCKPKSFCDNDNINCVPKCCKIGQIMREGETGCIDFDGYLKPLFEENLLAEAIGKLHTISPNCTEKEDYNIFKI